MRERGEYTKGVNMDHGDVVAFDRVIEITDANRGYRRPRIRTMGLTIPTELQRSQIAGFVMGYLNNNYDMDMALLEPLLNGLEHTSPGSSPFGRIGRVEFIHYPDNDAKLYRRGAGVFDTQGTPLFFARFAGLGDDGLRTDFSRWLLGQVGVTSDVFDEINGAVKRQYDTVVVSREAHSSLEGVEKTLPGYRVRDAWEWWIA